MEAKNYMNKGELVPDSVVIGLVKERLAQDDCKKGFILDGFPRNTSQAETLDNELKAMSMPLDVALSVDVDFDILLKRLTGRRTCKSCNQMYNIYYSPSSKADVCDKCGGALYQRDDDKEETIKKRLDVYKAQTEPLIGYYDKKGIVKSVNGLGDIAEIFNKICSMLEA
ncbi:adenylate kinase [Candidatus Magnetoovum chiemensis]|nr:adenylate kinase [Candidatus Magnetoovum chiemensis]